MDKYKMVSLLYKDANGQIRNYEDGCAELKVDVAATADGITVDVAPLKGAVELVALNVVYKNVQGASDKAFCNGYQAWTTSTEYAVTDKMHRLSFLSNIPAVKPYTSIYGDYNFCTYTGRKGDYHSHTYTYVKHPDATIDLYGSMSEASAFTVFYFSQESDTFRISKDVEGLVLDKALRLVDVKHYAGGYDDCFDAYFKDMGLAAPRVKNLKGYTSWYNYFQKIDENIILRDLNGLADANLGANIFQIDDGYQCFVGDYMDVNKTKFPNGMKYIADKIHDKKMLAGIWLAPFNAEKKSRVVAEHPDWLLKDKKGKPVLSVFAWSGAYTMDLYNPEVRAYIKKFFNEVINVWGFDMVKLDFLYSQCISPRNGKSRGMIMREGLEFLRECIGEKTLFLGCGVPLGSSFGIVDACRISCDVDIKFKFRWYYRIVNNEIVSARNAMNNSVFRRHLSGRAFANDPDVFFLRDDNLWFTDEEKETLLTVNNMFGDILFVSENIGAYNEKKLALIKKAFDKKTYKFVDCNYISNADIEVKYLDGKDVKTVVYHVGR